MTMETLNCKTEGGWEVVYDTAFSSMSVGDLLDALKDADRDAHVRLLRRDTVYEWYEAEPFSGVQFANNGLQVLLTP